MVVTLFPATWETGVEQDRIGLPSTWIVQAPHSPAPQPNFVPVSSRVSRRTQSKGVSGETLSFFSLPLTRSAMSMEFQWCRWETAQHGNQPAEKGEWRSGLKAGGARAHIRKRDGEV